MKLAPTVVGTLLAVTVTAACGSTPTAAPAPTAATTATTQVGPVPPTSAVRAGVPTVPADDRRGIPRVNGDDVATPQITSSTVVENSRPALVLTVPAAVLFGFGSAELRSDAETALQQAAALLGQHPGAQVEVEGHTDSVGSADVNQALSQQRAAVVVDWLVGHGVARARLHAVGYGATRPVASNATDEDRQRNRRVEFVIQDA